MSGLNYEEAHFIPEKLKLSKFNCVSPAEIALPVERLLGENVNPAKERYLADNNKPFSRVGFNLSMNVVYVWGY